MKPDTLEQRGEVQIQHDIHAQDGIVTMFVVFVLIAVSLVIVVALDNSAKSSESSKNFAQRQALSTTANAAVQTLQAAMGSGALNFDRNANDTLTNAELLQASSGEGGTIFSAANSGYTDSANPIVRVPGPGGDNLWQVVLIKPPSPTGDPQVNVVMYVRAWRQPQTTGPAAARQRSATKPEYIRVEMKQGTFADYQLLSDAPIRMDSGMSINGRVHSNGFVDDVQTLPGPNSPIRIWQGSTTGTCSTPANGTAPVVSTGTGNIGAMPAGCSVAENTDKFVDLAAAADSFANLRAACGTGQVICPSIGSPYYTGLNSQSVRQYSVNLSTLGTTAGTRMALLFDGDVSVSGSTAGRVTIAAAKPPAGGVPIPPSITIVGDVRHGTRTATTPAQTIGLIAEGNIVIDPSACGPRVVEAAMVAMTGSIGIGPRYATQITPAFTPLCPSLALTGSIASHQPLGLKWTWSGVSAGFNQRQITWDSNLAKFPPPFYPSEDPWEIVSSRPLDDSCLANPNGSGC